MCLIIWILLSMIVAGIIGTLMDYYKHKERKE